MAYDAEQHGAKCSECPFRATPVGPITNTAPLRLIVLGESPGGNEVVEGRPFVGASGRRLDAALKKAGCERASLHITNAVLCRPPIKPTPKQWASAIGCCRPRLERELAALPPAGILALGEYALRVSTNKSKITAWMGAPLSSPSLSREVLPSIHPAFVLRKPPYIPVFNMLVARALRMERHSWPQRILEAGQDATLLLQKLWEIGEPIGVDVETAGIDPMHDKLLCIGVGNQHGGVSIPWPCQHISTDITLRNILQADYITKVLHNAQHDLLSLEHNNVAVSGPIFDTLLAHAALAPQVPHDLGFVAMCELEGYERWKTLFRVADDRKGAEAFTKRDPMELREYNCCDAIATGLLELRLRRSLQQEPRLGSISAELHELSCVAQQMRESGVLVSGTNREAHRGKLVDLLATTRTSFEQAKPKGSEATVGQNGQHPSLKRLFFEELGAKPQKWSEITGEPCLDNATLTDWSTGRGDVATLAKIVLDFRKAGKLLSTYIDGLPVRDNLVHPTWKVWGTRTGRWASGGPNLQNQPKTMRDLYVPRPGNVLVAADYCLAKGTLIDTPRGMLPIEDLCHGDLVFTYNYKTCRPDCSHVVGNKFTGIRQTLVIILDNGKVVRCTPDHRWLRYNGSEVRADELKSGDRLLPLRRGHNGPKKYVSLYSRSQHEYTMLHRVVCARKDNKELAELFGHVHHKDGNHLNNQPENLVCLTTKQHYEEHHEQHLLLSRDPAKRAKMSIGISRSIKNRGGYWGNKNPNWGNKHGTVKQCAACNNEFYAYPSVVNKKYCSKKCYHATRRGEADLNHKVVAVINDGLFVPTYDIEVERDHNFALEAGVFVHNCQLELRIIALLAKDQPLLEAYANGVDVHTMTASGLFKVEESAVTKAMRNMAKTVEYGFNYQFSDDVTTVFKSISVKHPGISIREVQLYRNRWFEMHPALRTWQLQSVKAATQNKYVEAPVSGRRIVFHDGMCDPNVTLNHPIQATAGDLANRAMLAISKEIRWDAGEYILAQVHDEILLEGPDPKRLGDLLKRCMTQTLNIGGASMEFPVDLKYGLSWGTMKEEAPPCAKPCS